MRKLMIVDDENVTLYTLILQDDYQVVAPDSTDEMLEMATREVPDLVLMDLHLDYWSPPAKGVELIQQLRQVPATQATPVIVLSASYSDDAMSLCNRFVRKPVTSDELLRAVNEVLSEVESQPEP